MLNNVQTTVIAMFGNKRTQVGYQQQKVVFAEPKPVPKLYRAILLKRIQAVL